jgi:membrane protein required for colicin V production
MRAAHAVGRNPSRAMLKSADYWVVAFVLLSAIVGFMRGFLREVIAVVSWLLALFIAWHFSTSLESHLGGLLADPQVRPWAARAILILGVVFIGSVAGVFIAHFVRLTMFIGTDRFLGFTFGALRAGIVLGVLVIICQLLRIDEQSWWRESVLVPYAEHIAAGLRTLVGEQQHHVTGV